MQWFTNKLVVAGVCALLLACSSSQEPLKIGTNVWPGYALYYLAQDQGYIPSDAIRLIEYQNASFMSEAFVSGNLDGAMMTLDQALRLHELGIEFSIIQVINVSRGADVVMSQTPIMNLNGFAGKKIAVEQSAVGALILSAFEDHFEVPPDALEVISISADESLAAFRKGIDFIVTFVPFSHHIANEGGYQVFDTSLRPNLVVDVLVIKKQLLNTDYEPILRQMIQGFFQSYELLTNQPNKALPLLQKRLQLDEKQVLASFELLEITNLAQNRGMLSGSNAGLSYILKEVHKILSDADYVHQAMPDRSLYTDEFLPQGP